MLFFLFFFYNNDIRGNSKKSDFVVRLIKITKKDSFQKVVTEVERLLQLKASLLNIELLDI